MEVCLEAGILIQGVGHDMSHTASQGLDRAGGQASAVVVYALASMSIFLVGDFKGSMRGCQQFL